MLRLALATILVLSQAVPIDRGPLRPIPRAAAERTGPRSVLNLFGPARAAGQDTRGRWRV